MADKELVQLLQQLVEIPSVNPQGCADPSVCGEEKLADFLAAYLMGLGFEIEWQDRETGRPNLIASHGPRKPRRTLLLESHTDTVGVGGMRAPFEGRVEGGRLYGRGACDTKGPMAAALRAMSADVLAKLARAGIRVLFAGAMGEETGNVGADRLVERGLGADQAIVLEPTDLAIIHAHKGALWMEIEVGGVAAHASNPERGVNAIAGMMDVIRRLQGQLDDDQRRSSDSMLGGPTLNIGVIRGGSAANIVPDRCVVQVDRRTLPGERNEDIVERIRSALGLMRKEGRVTSFEVRIMKGGAPFSTPSASALVEALAGACRDAGREPKLAGAAWYSDAGPLSATCREIVVFGPGSIEQAHTADEYIDLDGLQAGCNVLRRFFERLAEAPA